MGRLRRQRLPLTRRETPVVARVVRDMRRANRVFPPPQATRGRSGPGNLWRDAGTGARSGTLVGVKEQTSARAALDEVFTVGGARAGGWTDAEIGSAVFERPFHGVRLVRAFDPEGFSADEEHRRRIRAFGVVAGAHEFVSHASAAVAWRLPLPAALIRSEIDVSVCLPRRSPRGLGVHGHAVEPRLVRVVEHPDLGIRVASPATTWAMLAAVLLDPYDLIAVGDALVRTPQHPDDPPPLATIAQLEAAVAAGRRVGIGALRSALPRVRTGASSRPETRMRLTLVDAGLPEPVLAHEVRDRHGGFLARLDLAYPQWRIAIEYEGEHHLTDSAQWTRDIHRYNVSPPKDGR